ncbi:amino acid adenylation domain-containing protein [Azoarcus sp. TTM-91]|uniref:non-ribosomal peptide synthetase n=1 Tax=Azoarcus sp. TTM-91 TaxID=2691581 RepID=UPI00145D957F|nr:non-ribosomal peptide synthetase [Azoarcus sp. TTM-91]NMG36149.1 amino acid adenylation domain-containing protein [Azoarcus sp. TTM-91]
MNSACPSPASPPDFVSRLRQLAEERADDVGLVIVTEQDGQPLDTPITYAALDRRVRALAAVLQARFPKGERALLLLDNDDHYVVAFFACLYAGLVAVPVFPPESSRPQHLARLAGIALDAQAACILSTAAMLRMMEAAMPGLGKMAPLAVDEVEAEWAERWHDCRPQGNDLAFLQYTSGSTSAPKGVMVSHANLMANERAIETGFSISTADVFVSWLPLYHDMGLIGGLLQPMHRGIRLVLMTPRFFLERPLRWLEAISRHRGTVSGGPDFAYRLCLERITEQQAAALDLSSWQVAFSGAEPVRHDTLQAFVQRFAAAGFSAGALYPCYGLAEATLFVTCGRRGSGMSASTFRADGLAQRRAVGGNDGRTLVACGSTVAGHAVSIRDPETRAQLEDGCIGEIWAGGPSICRGYWNKPEESAATFIAEAGETWLRTGDLGFMHQGQLHIAGRVKDLIIVRGHNLYPQDIERTVEAEVDAVRKGRVAAFAVEGPEGEGIGLAAEVPRSLQKLVAVDALVDMLSQVVGEAFGEALSVVVLLNPGALPKTSSGKLQRRACRQGWLEGTLDAYAVHAFGRMQRGGAQPAPQQDAAAPRDEFVARLATLWRAALKREQAFQIDDTTHFFSIGGNSLAAARLAAAIGEALRVALPPSLLFERPRFGDFGAEVRRLMETGASAEAGLFPVTAEADASGGLPLSPAQQRQWFLWELDPTGTAYQLQGALHLSGKLDADRLGQALAGLADRHESLRASFHLGASGEVVQRFISPSAFRLPVLRFDLSTETAEVAAGRLDEILNSLGAEPFDLGSAPLVRAALISLAEDEHVVALVMHHIVADGASMQLLIDELGAAYAGERISEAVPLGQSLRYVDYAVSQLGWLAGEDAGRQLAYWCQQLPSDPDGDFPILSLPTDHPRAATARYSAARHEFEISPQLTAKLRELASRGNATLFVPLLAGLQILLYRHTGLQDVRIGVPVANRRHAQTQRLVGLFVNTVVLRSLVDPRVSLAETLAAVRQAALEAQENQDLPFERVVEALQPGRSSAASPLFQVVFNHLQHDYGALERCTGSRVAEQPMPLQQAQFELTLETREEADGSIRASFIHARELFEPERIERLAEHYSSLLAAFMDDPAQCVGDIELLGEIERECLRQWGRGSCNHAHTLPVHRLFQEQARRRPEALALVFGDERVSYGELERRANLVAHHLLARGVGPECRVGVALGRSIEMVVALLAVLKAGGAYVPLDLAYPAERLVYMAQDSGVRLLITNAGGPLAEWSAQRGLAVVRLDELRFDSTSDEAPRVELHDESLAYLIYTSGSTGNPKGVAVAHGPLSMHCQETAKLYEMDEHSRELHFLSFSFDGAHERLHTALVCGAALILRDDTLWPAGQTLETMEREGVSNAGFPPAYLRELAEWASGRSDPPPVRLYSFGGEAMPQEGIKAVCEHLRPQLLINGYGPTEAVVTPMVWKVAGTAALDSAYAPIGRPVGDRKALVLDAEMNLLPAGAVGELYLGGSGLARGYFKRPAPSAAAFVADPFDHAGGRLYRTGDLVRWNVEGQLEYLGRIDQQVKVRGFRIELGEVEAQLLALAEVRQAVVVASAGTAGTRLIGYVALKAGAQIDGEALRDCLRCTLPDYMVPAAIVVLDALPLNANGKVDRRALPPPAFGGGAGLETPQGEVEAMLARIWAEALGVSAVGRHDNFFDLGGHSLLLMRVHRLIGERLPRAPSLIELFKFPTVAALARHLAGAAPAGAAADVVQAERAQRQRTALLRHRNSVERVR